MLSEEHTVLLYGGVMVFWFQDTGTVENTETEKPTTLCSPSQDATIDNDVEGQDTFVLACVQY